MDQSPCAPGDQVTVNPRCQRDPASYRSLSCDRSQVQGDPFRIHHLHCQRLDSSELLMSCLHETLHNPCNVTPFRHHHLTTMAKHLHMKLAAFVLPFIRPATTLCTTSSESFRVPRNKVSAEQSVLCDFVLFPPHESGQEAARRQREGSSVFRDFLFGEEILILSSWSSLQGRILIDSVAF